MSISSSGSDITLTAYDVPISAVAKWPPGNFTNPQVRHWYVPYGAVLEGLVTFVVAARLWTRIGKRAGGFGLDDILIIFGWAGATATYALGSFGVLNDGIDRHVWDVLPPIAAKAGFIAWITELTFLTSLCLTKISVLVFFRRLIDRTNNRRLSFAIMVAILFTIAYWITFFFFLVFACSPIDAAWKSLNIGYTGHYKCVHRRYVDPINGIFSIVSDAYAIIIPAIIVRTLSISRNRKITLYIVFGCGLVVLGAGAVRTYYLARMFTDPRRDLTWVGYDLLVWATLEMQLALICASAPAMKGFFVRFGEAVASRYGSNNNSALRSRFRLKNGASHDKGSLPAGSDSYNLTPMTNSLKHQSSAHDSKGLVYEWTEKTDEKPTTNWPGSEIRASVLSPPPTYFATGGYQSNQKARLSRHQPTPMTGETDYVQLNGSGIHVEQRWSVTSWDAVREAKDHDKAKIRPAS